ncbi:hypothetical protein H6S82_16420 [Planktothrix sp. FACHB-1355]|uniref:Uncharacterized protein n=1 Tax=Aerosakkonema funiforme FACHB-1375 TaxID=2949571 RepID=A0A926VJ99_9CYAN|nr:hypothetical protein [Aerosakkonema funiforme FACHB-1375]MBD3560425.1 hypothetical protein [Planktothrix sp. FACHB-1355]
MLGSQGDDTLDSDDGNNVVLNYLGNDRFVLKCGTGRDIK